MLNHSHSMEPEYTLETSEKTIQQIKASDSTDRNYQEVKVSLVQLLQELTICTNILSRIETHTLLLEQSLRDME